MRYFPTAASLIEALQSSQYKSILVLAAEDSQAEVPEIIQHCNRQDIIICGGIYPSIITGNRIKKTGYLLKKLKKTAPHILLRYPELTIQSTSEIMMQLRRTFNQVFVIADGLSPFISSFIQLFNRFLSGKLTFFGGGAGKSNFKQEDVIFNNTGLHRDAMLLIPFQESFNITVNHGWKPKGVVLLATRTNRNKIVEFNWQKAWEIYQETLLENTLNRLTKDNFIHLAEAYPFGIQLKSNQFVIRDPIGYDEELNLITTIDVNDNTLLHLMHADIDELLDAAKEVNRYNLSFAKQNAELFVFDCISRQMKMGDRFNEEINILSEEMQHQHDVILVGALSIGEIASDTLGMINFHNKTIISNLITNGKNQS
jgi:hypothetical protein